MMFALSRLTRLIDAEGLRRDWRQVVDGVVTGHAYAKKLIR